MYVAAKVVSWTTEVSALARVASNWPHAAYCTFTHGMIGSWVYLWRSIPKTGYLFQPLGDVNRLQVLPKSF